MATMTETTPTVKATSTRYGLRAPKGGCTVAGRTFKGGQFCYPFDPADPHGVGSGPEARPEPVRTAIKTAINGFVYVVEPVRIHPEVGSVAYRMEKLATRNTYHVHKDIYGEIRCDCPDFEFTKAGTGRPCKHGLRLIELGLIEATRPAPRRDDARAVPTPRPALRPRAFHPTPEEWAQACEVLRDRTACR